MSDELSWKDFPITEVAIDKLIAERGQLRQQLEQERARNAGIQYCEDCNTPLSACGEQAPDGTPTMDCLVCQLRSLLEQERDKSDVLRNVAEQGVGHELRLSEERDAALAQADTLRQRISELELLLRELCSYYPQRKQMWPAVKAARAALLAQPAPAAPTP